MSSIITGTGISLPERVVTNQDLERLMDTSDEWIRTRTGVMERRIAPAGVGTADLAAEAGTEAIDAAGVRAGDIDALVLATMTPDFYAPGSAPLVQDAIGLGQVPSYDIHQQCSGFLYGLDLADSLISADRAQRVLVIGAEVHSMYFPWAEQIQPLLERDTEPSPEEKTYNTRHRAWSVLFGDGAGAVVMEHTDRADIGWQGALLRTDGTMMDLIQVAGLGSRSRPYVTADDIAKDVHMPSMNGGRLFRQAVRLMPKVALDLLEEKGYGIDDVATVIAHQANGRIIEGVRKGLGLPKDKVPTNVERYGNTTAGSLPILYHEQKQGAHLSQGDLVCFVAFGAGAHWGAGLYREVSS